MENVFGKKVKRYCIKEMYFLSPYLSLNLHGVSGILDRTKRSQVCLRLTTVLELKGNKPLLIQKSYERQPQTEVIFTTKIFLRGT